MIRMLLFLLLLPRALWAEDVTVFAAASFKTALEEIAGTFEAETGHNVTLSFAGSSALARQISFGAPADLFISANAVWMDVLQDRGVIEPQSRVDLAGNQLVLIGSEPGLTWTPGQPLPSGRIAMGLSEAVPAGIYARQTLEALGLWQEAQTRAVQTDSVRAALALVALGEAQIGFVYASDAIAEARVFPIAPIPADLHEPIIYPAALIKGGNDAARMLLGYLTQPPAQAVLKKHGFTAP